MPRMKLFPTQDHSNHRVKAYRPKEAKPISDSEGLARAYKSKGNTFVYGDTLYVAGTHPTSAKDWYDDVTKIPFWGDLRNSDRYQEANKTLNENRLKIGNVVGHSLGGSVALELQKNYKGLDTRTYGSPVWDPLGKDGKVERYRNWFDPVSMFDRSSETSFKKNPFESFSLFHDYWNLGHNNFSGNSHLKAGFGWKKPV